MSELFSDVLQANLRYSEDFSLSDLPSPARKNLGILTCIDSRIDPLEILGLQPGDAKIFRNAGARVTEDAIRSLALAANLLNVTRIMILSHTGCAMNSKTDGELRSLFTQRYPDTDVDDLSFNVFQDQRATLLRDVERLKNAPLMPTETIVEGFIYDVHTGLVTPIA